MLVDLTDENVLAAQLGDIGTEKLVSEGKSTARLSSNVKVTKSFCNFTKASFIVNLNHSLVERLIEVTTHLRNTVEIVTCFVFNDLGETDGSVAIAGQVIDVKEVFALGETGLHFCFFFCL